MRDQPFAVKGGELLFDLIGPDTDERVPLVIFLHGGGWISGDKTMYREEAAWLANQGIAAACPSYRLAPLYPFPTPVADCQAFVNHVRANSGRFGVDTDQLFVIGNSAGGHLALMLGLASQNFNSGEQFETVKNVVSICGISNLCDTSSLDFQLSLTFAQQFMDCPYDENPELWKSASPIQYAPQAEGRFLLIHGTADDVVPFEQSQELFDALQTSKASSKLVKLDGESHSFTYPGWEAIRMNYLEFLNQTSGVF